MESRAHIPEYEWKQCLAEANERIGVNAVVKFFEGVGWPVPNQSRADALRRLAIFVRSIERSQLLS